MFFSHPHGKLPVKLLLILGTLFFVLVAWMSSFTVNAFSSSPERAGTAETVSANQLMTFKLGQGKSLADILDHETGTRLFFVGEHHTRYDHHLVQLAAVKNLYQQSSNLAIGVEWFQQPFQKDLDDYISGRISEAQMLERTQYYERWRYDYRLYRPIMQFARDKAIRVIALNASPAVSKALKDKSYAELPESLQSQIPENYDWSDKAYENRLSTVFKMHPEFPGEFEDFLRGQLTWDESMAYRTARFLLNNPRHRILVFAGNGHIEHGSGIPNRVKRHIDVSQVSILVSSGKDGISNDMADYLVMTREQFLKPVGLIGAMLDIQNNRVIVKGFSKNSAAEDAGVPKGAVITAVNEMKVGSFTQFKLAMLDKQPGETIKLSYLDNPDEDLEQVKSASLKLR